MTRKEILEAARQCVCGDREEDYGSPENNFARIAGLWSAYLGVPIRVWDVAAMLALLKIGRIGGGQVKLDNWIDLAGYAACGGEIQSGEAVTQKDRIIPEPVPLPDPIDDDDVVKTYSPVVVVLRDDEWEWLPSEMLPEIDRICKGKGDITVYPDCTVEVVKLPDGTESKGWWHNDKPPVDLSGIWVEDDGDE
jgi:hypothetical protein